MRRYACSVVVVVDHAHMTVGPKSLPVGLAAAPTGPSWRFQRRSPRKALRGGELEDDAPLPRDALYCDQLPIAAPDGRAPAGLGKPSPLALIAIALWRSACDWSCRKGQSLPRGHGRPSAMLLQTPIGLNVLVGGCSVLSSPEVRGVFAGESSRGIPFFALTAALKISLSCRGMGLWSRGHEEPPAHWP